MIAGVIKFVLSNFTLTFIGIWLLFSAGVIFTGPKPYSLKSVTGTLLSYYLLFNIGIGNIYNFICHVFFAEMSAAFIGWADSPFQLEVGFASLGFGVVGLLAFRAGPGFRAAAVTGPALFLWGAAGGHVFQMIKARNFAPGNAGVVFWTDIFLPVIGFLLLYLQRRTEKIQV
ncbi:DUF6790 family protein [Candidatus Omnitrophota bacterium]